MGVSAALRPSPSWSSASGSVSSSGEADGDGVRLALGPRGVPLVGPGVLMSERMRRWRWALLSAGALAGASGERVHAARRLSAGVGLHGGRRTDRRRRGRDGEAPVRGRADAPRGSSGRRGPGKRFTLSGVGAFDDEPRRSAAPSGSITCARGASGWGGAPAQVGVGRRDPPGGGAHLRRDLDLRGAALRPRFQEWMLDCPWDLGARVPGPDGARGVPRDLDRLDYYSRRHHLALGAAYQF